MAQIKDYSKELLLIYKLVKKMKLTRREAEFIDELIRIIDC